MLHLVWAWLLNYQEIKDSVEVRRTIALRAVPPIVGRLMQGVLCVGE